MDFFYSLVCQLFCSKCGVLEYGIREKKDGSNIKEVVVVGGDASWLWGWGSFAIVGFFYKFHHHHTNTFVTRRRRRRRSNNFDDHQNFSKNTSF